MKKAVVGGLFVVAVVVAGAAYWLTGSGKGSSQVADPTVANAATAASGVGSGAGGAPISVSTVLALSLIHISEPTRPY